ncbi:Peptidyl-prolyl cis-trans isomerase [Nymphaea thermarum]|nr:Peptidyl-prolyl cis-trans isomerase [Nymphaea thermarum]
MASTLLSIPSAKRISAVHSSSSCVRRCRRQCLPDRVYCRFPCVSSRAPSSNAIADMQVSSSIPTSSLFLHVTKQLQKAVSVAAIVVQILSPLPLGSSGALLIPNADAVLYSPDTKVPRTAELALRKAIPGNSAMKSIQEPLENISYLLRIPQRKPYGTMEGDVKKALKAASNEKESILNSLPADQKERGLAVYASLMDGKGGLQDLIQSIKENDPDKISVNLSSSLDMVAELELLQAPGLSFLLPDQYLNYPRLTGRGMVEFIFEKGDDSKFSTAAGGEQKGVATIQVALDGYSAPLTAGNFAKLVLDGAYDGIKLKSVNQAVISDNERASYGFSVPLEIMPSGQFEPMYRTMLDVQDGELPILPLSVYGAIAMAHSPDSDEYSSASQFFIYLYDRRSAGLGGLSFDEGQFSVFGYVTAGREILSQLKTGDMIRSAKLLQGQDRLILPVSSN